MTDAENPENNKNRGRYQFLLATYGKKVHALLREDKKGKSVAPDLQTAFASFAAYDPTAKDAHKPYRYLQWLCIHYLKSGGSQEPIKAEDFYKLKNDLLTFDQHKRHLPVAERDINRYTPEQLKNLVLRLDAEHAISNRDLKQKLTQNIRDETQFVYDGPEGTIVIPRTEAASVFWGQNTRWCTAATKSENAFNDFPYGPLVIYLPNNPGTLVHKKATPLKDTWGRAALNWLRSFAGLSIMRAFKIAKREYDARYISYIDQFADSTDKQLYEIPAGLKPLIEAAIRQETGNADIIYGNMPFSCVPEDCRSRTVYLNAITECEEEDSVCFILKSIPEEYLRDPDFTIELARRNYLFVYAVTKKSLTPAECLAACERVEEQDTLLELAEYFPEHMWRNPDFCRQMVERDLNMLDYVPARRRTSELVVLAAKQTETLRDFNDIAGEAMVKHWETDPVFCKAMVAEDFRALEFVPPKHMDSDMILTAARQVEDLDQFSFVLQIAPNRLAADEDLCLQLVRCHYTALRYIPEKFITTAMCLEALSQRDEKEVWQWVPQKVQDDIAFQEAYKSITPHEPELSV